MIVGISILILWMISLCLHEYGHARVAFAGGDITVEAKGYLTLNPLRYLHPTTSIVIPLIILALGGIPLPGGAVYIDHTRLRSRAWESAVSAAGPFANLIVFVICGLPFAFNLHEHYDNAGTLWPTLAFFAFLQALTVIINLIPVPGIDGFGIIEPHLPYNVRKALRPYQHLGIFALLILMLLTPGFSRWMQSLCFGATAVFNIPIDLIIDGNSQFRASFGR